jgi:endonuclease YncB( thermonuclease family)
MLGIGTNNAVRLVAALCLFATPALAQSFEVTDGDTLKAPWGELYRLHGIDAPELAQECEKEGEPYSCGLEAKEALEAFLEGKEVLCGPIDQDRYSRTLAICLADGADVGEEMVLQGWALDYPRYSSYEYARAQQWAKALRLGMWAGEFTEPWVWRQERRE